MRCALVLDVPGVHDPGPVDVLAGVLGDVADRDRDAEGPKARGCRKGRLVARRRREHQQRCALRCLPTGGDDRLVQVRYGDPKARRRAICPEAREQPVVPAAGSDRESESGSGDLEHDARVVRQRGDEAEVEVDRHLHPRSLEQRAKGLERLEGLARPCGRV